QLLLLDLFHSQGRVIRRRPPLSSLFPYPALFRSRPPARCAGDSARPLRGGDGAADDRRGVPLALNPARGAAENRPVAASFPVLGPPGRGSDRPGRSPLRGSALPRAREVRGGRRREAEAMTAKRLTVGAGWSMVAIGVLHTLVFLPHPYWGE